jgi:hypothetical protein
MDRRPEGVAGVRSIFFCFFFCYWALRSEATRRDLVRAAVLR